LEKEKSQNLGISEEEKCLEMRKISESRNKWNLGISELAEFWNLTNLERNLGTSQCRAQSWNKRNLGNLKTTRISEPCYLKQKLVEQ
jgi:hypothetical protein